LEKAMETYRSVTRGICHHAYRPTNTRGTRYYLTEKIVVQFDEELSANSIDDLIQEYGLKILREYPQSQNTYLLRVTSSSKINPLKMSNVLSQLSSVWYAEPNLINRFQQSHLISNSSVKHLWYLDATKGPQLAENADISIPEAWKRTRGNHSVVIAVIDTGFDLTQPYFEGESKVVHFRDFVDEDAIPQQDFSEKSLHGTLCAAVALANDGDERLTGVAPGCAFLPIRINMNIDDVALWEVFDYAGRHADIIVCGWGPPPVNAPLLSLTKEKLTELKLSGGPRGNGCNIVVAAGNYNSPIDDQSNKNFVWNNQKSELVNCQGPIHNGLAAHPDVITVSAITSQLKKAAYSNWGKEISCSAPGSNFHPTDPNIVLSGRQLLPQSQERYAIGLPHKDLLSNDSMGTSLSASIVAGVAALVRSTNPDLTAQEVKDVILEMADKIIDNDPDTVLGHRKGKYVNGHSEWFGHGRVNAARSVEKAVELRKRKSS
ncbi:MAG: S8 family serine peptidase, partial [Rhodospirillales bacterium]|nr:S8 family serine peptidase [Rhodospirillales bacterium]